MGMIIDVILSIICTHYICKIWFRNTIGTTSAYFRRRIYVFAFSLMIIGTLLSFVGLM